MFPVICPVSDGERRPQQSGEATGRLQNAAQDRKPQNSKRPQSAPRRGSNGRRISPCRSPRSGWRRTKQHMDLREQLGIGVKSLEAVRSIVGIPRPAALRTILTRYDDPIVFEQPLVTPDRIALGGHQTITLERSGRTRYQGHMRATGFPSYNFGVCTVLKTPVEMPLVFVANGRVHGTNEPGEREYPWDQFDASGLINLHWSAMKAAVPQTEIKYDANYFGTIGDLLGFIASLYTGGLLGGAPMACLMLGVRAAEQAGANVGTGGLAGVTVAGAVLVVFGPGAIVPAVVAGAAAGTAGELALKHRPMSAAERDFAEQVYKKTLPFDRILLTNMIGLGRPYRRCFTIPTFGQKILVNLGEGFEDPMGYAGFGDPANPDRQKPGQLFIHELCHAWQIQTKTFEVGYLCEGIVAQSTTTGGNMSVYRYGAADRPYGKFNLEQRAHIVDDWFGGTGNQKDHGEKKEDDTNPYFKYIRDNIRARIP